MAYTLKGGGGGGGDDDDAHCFPNYQYFRIFPLKIVVAYLIGSFTNFMSLLPVI
jgi:hypothetical protein